MLLCDLISCPCYQSSNLEDKDAWKDRGMGQLNIKCKEGVSKGSNESKPTIVIRNDVRSFSISFSDGSYVT